MPLTWTRLYIRLMQAYLSAGAEQTETVIIATDAGHQAFDWKQISSWPKFSQAALNRTTLRLPAASRITSYEVLAPCVCVLCVCAPMSVCVYTCAHAVKVLCENNTARTNAWPLSRCSLHNHIFKHMLLHKTLQRQKNIEQRRKTDEKKDGNVKETEVAV